MRKRWMVPAVILVVLVVAGGVIWRVLRVPELTSIGTGYAAQQTCACLFISKRSLESCRMDLDALARRLVSVRVGTAEVSASSLGIAHARARYLEGFGCSLDP